MATAKKKSTSSFIGYGTNVKAGKKISASVQKKVVKGIKSGATQKGATMKWPKGEDWLAGTGVKKTNSVAAKRISKQLDNRAKRGDERNPSLSAKKQGRSGYAAYLGKTKNKRG